MSAAVMEAIWERHRPTMLARVELLERAAVRASAGALKPPLADEARTAAHQLAGSVGTFGYARASELARELETRLKEGAAAGTEPLVASLRAALEAPPFIADVSAPTPGAGPAPPPPPSAAPPAPPPPVLPPPPKALPLVLFVTADQDTAKRMRSEAARRGLRAAVAAGAEAAVAVLRREPAAAVVAFGADAMSALGSVEPPLLVVAEDASLAGRRVAAQHGAELFLQAGATAPEVLEATALVLERAATGPPRVLAVGVVADIEGVDLIRIADSSSLLEDLLRYEPAVLVLGAGEDAGELCRILRADQRWAALPILVSATEDVTDADDVVADPAELADRVHARVRRARTYAALAETDPATGAANGRSARLRLARLLRLAERHELAFCVVAVEVADAANAVELGTFVRRTLRGEDVVWRRTAATYVLGMLGVDRETAVDRIDNVRAASRVAFSAGVAQYPADATDLEGLLDAAGRGLRTALGPGPKLVVGAGRGGGTTRLVDVAIVEDEDAAAAAVATSLSARGHSCWRFSNGASAIDMMGGEQPQLRAGVILLDLNLPAVGGVELLTLLADHGVLRGSRVLVLSANSDPAMIERTQALGAEDYLIKPVDLEALALRVDEALGRKRQ